jgi:hypothetical protein
VPCRPAVGRSVLVGCRIAVRVGRGVGGGWRVRVGRGVIGVLVGCAVRDGRGVLVGWRVRVGRRAAVRVAVLLGVDPGRLVGTMLAGLPIVSRLQLITPVEAESPSAYFPVRVTERSRNPLPKVSAVHLKVAVVLDRSVLKRRGEVSTDIDADPLPRRFPGVRSLISSVLVFSTRTVTVARSPLRMTLHDPSRSPDCGCACASPGDKQKWPRRNANAHALPCCRRPSRAETVLSRPVNMLP